MQFKGMVLFGLFFILFCSFKSNDDKVKDFFNEIQKYDLYYVLACGSSLGYKPPAPETFYSLQLANT